MPFCIFSLDSAETHWVWIEPFHCLVCIVCEHVHGRRSLGRMNCVTAVFSVVIAHIIDVCVRAWAPRSCSASGHRAINYRILLSDARSSMLAAMNSVAYPAVTHHHRYFLHAFIRHAQIVTPLSNASGKIFFFLSSFESEQWMIEQLEILQQLPIELQLHSMFPGKQCNSMVLLLTWIPSEKQTTERVFQKRVLRVESF